MSRLSVIIPVVRTLPRLEDTLVSVLEYRSDDCEVIVVLDEPYPDPYNLEGEITFLQAGVGLGLARAINIGCCAAGSPWIHILVCGNLVARGWSEAAAQHFDNGRVGVVVPLVVEGQDARILAAGMGYDQAGRLIHLQRGVAHRNLLLSRRMRVLPHFSGALFRRDQILAIGGADESLGDGWVLADLTLRLFQAGFLSVLEPSCCVKGDPSLEPGSLDYVAARDAERFFWRWSERRSSTLLRHLALLTSQTLAALPRGQMWRHVVGRLAGWRGSRVAQQVGVNGHSRPTFLSGNHSPPASSASGATYVARAG